MRVSRACLPRWLLPGLPLLYLAGCPVRPAPPPPAPTAAPSAAPAAHFGVPYSVASAESLLTIRAYRGGTLAAAGHNHLIASHELEGTVYVPADVHGASFELRVPVATLTIDEAPLRAAEASADFAAEVPDSAREGTRRNMLSEALLDGAHFPQIELRSLALSELTPPQPGVLNARVQALVRAEAHEFSVPVHYEVLGGTLSASGELALRQSELGLKPFSALLGALQVQDERRLSFRLRAHASGSPR